MPIRSVSFKLTALLIPLLLGWGGDLWHSHADSQPHPECQICSQPPLTADIAVPPVLCRDSISFPRPVPLPSAPARRLFSGFRPNICAPPPG